MRELEPGHQLFNLCPKEAGLGPRFLWKATPAFLPLGLETALPHDAEGHLIQQKQAKSTKMLEKKKEREKPPRH